MRKVVSFSDYMYFVEKAVLTLARNTNPQVDGPLEILRPGPAGRVLVDVGAFDGTDWAANGCMRNYSVRREQRSRQPTRLQTRPQS